jgi:hypothetical protein
VNCLSGFLTTAVLRRVLETELLVCREPYKLILEIYEGLNCSYYTIKNLANLRGFLYYENTILTYLGSKIKSIRSTTSCKWYRVSVFPLLEAALASRCKRFNSPLAIDFTSD